MTRSRLRLARFRREPEGGVDWWSPPPGDKTKDRPSVRDAERLFRGHRPEFLPFLAAGRRDEGEAA